MRTLITLRDTLLSRLIFGQLRLPGAEVMLERASNAAPPVAQPFTVRSIHVAIDLYRKV